MRPDDYKPTVDEGSGPGPRPASPSPEGVRWWLDRTAVLVVGLIAGYLVGICFAPSTSVAGAVQVPVPVIVPPAQPSRSSVAADTVIDPRVIGRVARTGIVRIGVFGDSFGVGVWGALYRLLPASEGYRVLKFAKEATGFTRYRVSNLEEDARGQLAVDPVDVAVVSMGVNDASDMWDGKLYPFMSDGWKRVIGERADRFVAAARSTGARVYWIGLPAMRDPALDAKVQALNAFFAIHMARLGVPFLDTRPLSVDGAGRYAGHLPDPRTGAPALVRTGDGIHMIGIGYERILKEAVGRIHAYVAQVRIAAHRPAPVGTGKPR